MLDDKNQFAFCVPRRWRLGQGALIGTVVLMIGCSSLHEQYIWRARDFALTPEPAVRLLGRNEEIIASLNTKTVQKLMLAHFRINRTAGIAAELVIVEDENPNAFATVMNGRRVIAINTAMINFIGDDIDEYAALLGHEAAHWAKGHVEKGETRAKTIQLLGGLVGAGLGMAGVPAAGTITGLGAGMIEASYSRDDEREADAAGLDYMIANGFDPKAAVRLHGRMLKEPGGLKIPFLSSHPSGEERMDNLRALIKEKES